MAVSLQIGWGRYSGPEPCRDPYDEVALGDFNSFTTLSSYWPRMEMIDASIFEDLQNLIDEEALVRDDLKDLVKDLEKHCMY